MDIKTEQTQLTEVGLIEAFKIAKENLVNYRRVMLICGEDEVAPASFHFEWSDLLLNGDKHEAIEGFRESAKSQYVLRSFLSYCLTYPSKKRDYIVIIKKNDTLAANKLKETEKEYHTNPAISANCVKIHEESGDVFSVDVRDENGAVINVRIESYGKGASIRGLSNLDRRPKIVVVDDPQDVGEADSETVQENDWKWFLGDVMFLGQKTRIFLIGNNLGERCIIERAFAHAKELNFHTQRVPTLTPEGKSAWPTKYSIEEIEDQKAKWDRMGKLDIWLREKMCLAVSEETRTFHEQDYRSYSAPLVQRIAQGCNIFFTIDPASSKEKTACYRAIVINAVDYNNKWFILEIPYGRWDSAQLMDVLFEKVQEWKPLEVGFEKGMFKQIIEPFIYNEMSRKNVFFDIVPIEHAKQGSKLARVKMLGPRFKAHQIWFPSEAYWLPELKTELQGVTRDGFKSLFVDLIDALAMQEQIAKKPFNKADANSLPRQAVEEIEEKKSNQVVVGVDLSSLPRVAA